LDEDDEHLIEAERIVNGSDPSLDFLRGEGDCAVREMQDAEDPSSRLFDDVADEQMTGAPRLHTRLRRSKDRKWERELNALVRQKWSHAQCKSIRRAMERLKKTTGTHSAIVIIPETFNASTFATTGSYADFIRGWTAGLADVQSRKGSKLRCSVTELVGRFNNEASSNRSRVFDGILTQCRDLLPAAVIQKAREALDVELASDTAAPFRPENTKFSQAILAALTQYGQSAAVDVAVNAR